VIVRGVEPVALVEETEGRLYFSARVRPLADEPGEPAAELSDLVLGRFRELAGLQGDAMPEAPEGVPLSYAIAGALELPPAPKQELLESRDERHRLELLAEILSSADEEVRHARVAAARASTNGRVTTP
jgi:Lon protease-like protein